MLYCTIVEDEKILGVDIDSRADVLKVDRERGDNDCVVCVVNDVAED